MPERWGGPGFGPNRRAGFRPPWWPEGEPYPSSGPGSWRGVRRHFLRRVGVFLAGFFALLFAANALAIILLSRSFGPPGRRGGIAPVAIVGLVLLAIALVVIARVVRRLARPIGEVMEAADRVASGDYAARVEPRGVGDVRRLAGSFNAMAERLESNEEQRRNLLADLAHELRTPLSVIRGNVEGMLDGLYPADPAHLGPLLEESVVMSRLLDDLQTLSMAEAGVLRLHRERVHPGDLIEEAVGAFRARAEEAGVRLEARVNDGLAPVDVDPVRIGEVLANLLSNALRHTPTGGSVVVTAQRNDGGELSLAVSDTGSGIRPEDLPHVFGRFVKGGDSGGAGLGLAIARGIVEAHGGSISARSEPGAGTTLRFSLPATP